MKTQSPPLVRCAVYTRKSSEEGLEQSFNSLDAQREAAESYIQSQRGEGWVCLPKHYDDGGYSGGNTDRPALKELLRDIENGLIDCVVCYKVDRLSRSLLDFAVLIGNFEKYGATFVSVTQQFNSTTSMGRLTLNILLSFAQFEREIIGERIRDKISAAKKKGKYTGGCPVLGYDSVKAKLFVNPDEAKTVQHIFQRFLVLPSPMNLARELNADGIPGKTWTTGKGKVHTSGPWNKNKVYNLLTNCKYIGEITHFDKVFTGEHEAIIDQPTWDQVQGIFRENAHARAGEARNRTPALLKGILRCGHCGASMGITYTKKKGRVYRYYQCLSASKKGYDTCPVKSIPAGEIESAVVTQIREVLRAPEVIAKAALTAEAEGTPPDPREFAQALGHVDTVWSHLFPMEQARICRLLLEHVEVRTDGLEIRLQDCGIRNLAAELLEGEDDSA